MMFFEWGFVEPTKIVNAIWMGKPNELSGRILIVLNRELPLPFGSGAIVMNSPLIPGQ